ncbi:MAG: FAD-dependent oxidoreductase [Deltaproteobacteria bacterium]|nr:MAG: FAD-dependent oxidoreductase [Deltaproteobacteria bacterium]
MRRDLPFEEISPWVQVPEDRCEALDGDRAADVVVIGAGYTGLSTALSLRAEGADVAVLEQDFAGAGASGRNAGHLTPTIGKDLPTLLRLFGRERAAALVRFADQAVEFTEALIEKHGIACDYVPSGNVLAAVHEKHERRLRRAADTAADLGGQVRFLSAAEMRERGLPASFHCGVLEERGGTLDPGRYVMGLRRAARDAGVRLFEGTRVLELSDTARVRVRSDRGSVTADVAVLATNAYTPALGWKRATVMPLRVALFETEPLDASQRAALGWRGREGIYTSHELLESYRLTAHGTLVGGAKVVRNAWGGALPRAYDPGAFRILERAFRERFPELGELPVRRFWGGWIGLTLDFLPVLGAAGSHHNVHYGIGYAGHGVAQATLMGAMLADRIRGREHSCEAALARSERSWPPEPVRWLASRLLNRALSIIDARTDRQVRRRQRRALRGPPRELTSLP